MFGSRLKTLRNRDQISQAKLANELNISQQTVAKWESKNPNSTPDPEMILRIADFFGTSTDYLLGKSSYASPHTLSHKEYEITNSNILELIEVASKSSPASINVAVTLLKSLNDHADDLKK